MDSSRSSRLRHRGDGRVDGDGDGFGNGDGRGDGDGDGFGNGDGCGDGYGEGRGDGDRRQAPVDFDGAVCGTSFCIFAHSVLFLFSVFLSLFGKFNIASRTPRCLGTI